MKNILATGGCGFIGSNFIRYLLRREDFKGRIINVDQLTYAGNPESLADLDRMIQSAWDWHRFDKKEEL